MSSSDGIQHSNFRDLENIRAVLNCPSLEIHMSHLWGAQTPDYRLRIRQFLLENIRVCGGPENDILNLDKVPQMSSVHSSISHGRDYGVIVFAQNPVGVDIESLERIQEKIVLRVSTPEEFQSAPDAASLWVAKESAYKALRSFRQPSVMSQVETGAWQKLDSQSETFTVLNHHLFDAPAGRGLVIKNNSHALSIFVFHA